MIRRVKLYEIRRKYLTIFFHIKSKEENVNLKNSKYKIVKYLLSILVLKSRRFLPPTLEESLKWYLSSPLIKIWLTNTRSKTS